MLHFTSVTNLFGIRCKLAPMADVLASERPRPVWLRNRPRAWLAAVATVCVGAFLGQLDASIVALAYDGIGRDFGAGLGAVQVVSLSYLAALGALLLPLGRVSDRLGRKRMYLWGFAVFAVASGACAGAPTLGVLAACRAVQGAGAALLQANSVAIVTTSAPATQLRRALGMQAAAQAVGLAAGPTLGGVLVQTLGWRAIFALNVPIGLAGVVAGRYLLPRTRLEPAGAATVRDVVGTRGVLRGLSGALLAYLVLFGPIVLVPTVLQRAGTSAVAAGLLLAALPAGFALGALAGQRLVPRAWTIARQSALGLAVTAAGLTELLGTAPVDRVGWAVGLAICGIGLGLFTHANNAFVMGRAPRSGAAVAGGLVSASRAVGTAAATVLVAATAARAGDGRVTLAVLLAAVGALAVTIPRKRDSAR
jgi:predicted MFS family arabinose efflux permease